MKSRKAGNRYPLLFYQRVMDRLWRSTLLLGVLLLVAWSWSWFSTTPLFDRQENNWLVVGSVVLLCFSIFAFFGRKMAYVQTRQDHVRLVTPFLRTNISYRRIRRFHPTAFQQLFPLGEASWAQSRLLSAFYGTTVIVLELNSYPFPRALLRFFLAPQMFSPQSTGLVLLVPNWMKFSTELETYRSKWLQAQNKRQSTSIPLRYGYGG